MGYDTTVTFDYMPSQFITFRAEMGYRHTDLPYWTGRGGITSREVTTVRQLTTPVRLAPLPELTY